jgi:hypothetical protein
MSCISKGNCQSAKAIIYIKSHSYTHTSKTIKINANLKMLIYLSILKTNFLKAHENNTGCLK